jgi:hypothetical protein
MPERGEYGGDGVLGLVGLLLVVAGEALPEGVRSTAIHILAVGFFAGAFVFLVRDHAKRESGVKPISENASKRKFNLGERSKGELQAL